MKKKIITILVIIIIFFIGISRIYLGVHFTRDVLLGWTIGLILLWGYFKLEKPVARWISKKTLLIQIMYIFLFCMILVALGCASLYSLTNWQLPNAWIETALLNGAEEPDPLNFEGVVTFAGVAFGFLSGFAWWVKKYGVPKIQGSFLKRFLRYLVGIIGVVIFYIGLKYVFPEDPLWLGFILRFARYGIIGLWVSAIAPIIFRKIKLSE